MNAGIFEVTQTTDGPRWLESRCRTTRWSVVLAAAAEGEDGRNAQALLYRLYFQPLVSFIARRRGQRAATELAHDFFAERVVRAGDLRRLERRPGVRFRAWLFKALLNFLKNEWKFARRQRRDVTKTMAWDSEGDESVRCIAIAASGHDQEQLLARKRALQLLSDVLLRLRHEYCAHAAISGVDGTARFEAIKVFLPGPSTEEAEYAECAAKLGMSADSVKQLVRRLRVRFAALLNEALDPDGDGGGKLTKARRALYQALELPPAKIA